MADAPSSGGGGLTPVEVRLLSAACRQKGSRRELFVVLREGYGDGVSTEERHPSLDDRFDPAVRIVDYETTWPALAEAELHRIEETLSGVACAWSTWARPLCRVSPPSPSSIFCSRSLQSSRPPDRPRTFHPHVCEAGSEHEFRHLALRDFLRPHDDEAARYAALKRRVAGRHPQDRLAYIEGKSAYVAALEGRCR